MDSQFLGELAPKRNFLHLYFNLMKEMALKIRAETDSWNLLQFDYAWCLIRSKYVREVKEGLLLLEDLLRKVRLEEGAHQGDQIGPISACWATFVERSSTTECTCQPPPQKWKRLQLALAHQPACDFTNKNVIL
jgi:hypothetical protein